MPPILTHGPAYLIFAGFDHDDGVPRCRELDAVYVSAAGEPRLARLEANGPSSPRERQHMLGGALTHLQLDSRTRMLLRMDASDDTTTPVNAAATALLSRYPATASAGPVRGNILLIGTRGDSTEADAPDAAKQHLADLGYQVTRGDESP
jgi:hypothetical protein